MARPLVDAWEQDVPAVRNRVPKVNRPQWPKVHVAYSPYCGEE